MTTITDLWEQGVFLEDVRYLAGHADPRTTRLYDPRQRRVIRNIVERLSVSHRWPCSAGHAMPGSALKSIC